MKKLLILAATTAAISSGTAFADIMPTMDTQFYLKVAAGANKLNEKKEKELGLKLKSKTVPLVNLAVGYYVMDNVRAEFEGGYLINPKMRKTGNVPGYDNVKATIQVKPTIWTLMASGYVDVADLDTVKPFVGAGLGMSSVKEKANYRASNNTTGEVNTQSASSKKKWNFSYHLTAGVGADVADGVVAELAYRWQDYGKAKAKKGEDSTGLKYRGHNLVAAVRFAL